MIEHLSHQGSTVRYSVEGSGPPLLMCNGIGAPFELMEPLREELHRHTTIAWDAPGSGGSSVPLRPPSMRYVANTAAALLDHLALGSSDVLGVSWGGLVAQELAIHHPQRVRRLVLAATGTGWTSIPGDPMALRAMLSVRRYTSPTYLRRVGPRLYGGDIGRDPGLLEQQSLARLRHAPSNLGYWWQATAAVWWTSMFRLGSIQQATLVMAGDDDPIAHVHNARIISSKIPNAVLELVEGGGHLFLLTRPRASARSIERFLDGSREAA